MSQFIYQSVSMIPGIGPRKEKQLNKLEIHKIIDLIYDFPFRYENRRLWSKDHPLSLAINKKIALPLEIIRRKQRGLSSRKTIQEFVGSYQGNTICCIFFNQPYLMDKIKVGMTLFVFGLLQKNMYTYKMVNPFYESNHMKTIGSIVPIYRLTAGISQQDRYRMIKWVKENTPEQALEIFPEKWRKRHKVMGQKQALIAVHFPSNKRYYQAGSFRLLLTDFFLYHLQVIALAKKRVELKGISFEVESHATMFLSRLPFSLTCDQKQVMQTIQQEMADSVPIKRLIQGDVGSGKTVIALCALFITMKNKRQSALIAPTEILAEQHYQTFKKLLNDQEKEKLVLLSGRIKASEKKQIYQKMKAIEDLVVIGTHALLQESVCFFNLGLIIMDEQHRFGVAQRAYLLNESEPTPDFLVLSATPIPRTMQLIFEEELDLSTIKTMPKGRKKINTTAYPLHLIHQVIPILEKEIAKGRQAYFVYPLIEEADTVDWKDLESNYKKWSNGLLKQYTCGLLHGKMKAVQKEQVMQSFYRGTIQVLFSTTVIEVGIDNPNATVMVIEEAQQFGLAQLHQLRGRVGRSHYQSYCFLLYREGSETIENRMNIMTQSQDGFEIAEADLLLRGAGDLYGTKQHGHKDSIYEKIVHYPKIDQLAKEMVHQQMQEPINLSCYLHQNINQQMAYTYKTTSFPFLQ